MTTAIFLRIWREKPAWVTPPGILALLLTAALGPSSCHRASQPPKPYLAFVANTRSNSIAVVNLATFHVVKGIAVSPGPRQLVLRPQTHEVYVSGNSGMIDVIEYPALQVTRSFKPVHGGALQGLVFSPDGAHAYVLETSSGLAGGDGIYFVECPAGDKISRLLVPGHITALALTPDGKTLVAADSGAHKLLFVDAKSGKYSASVETGKSPASLAIVPDSSKVFVADRGEQKVSSVDVGSRQLLSNLEVGVTPSSLLVKPDGGEIFVLSGTSATLVIVDAFHDNVEQNLTTGRNPVAAVIRRDQSILYIANSGDGSVSMFSVEDRTSMGSVHVGTSPRAMALTPDERFLAVADGAASSLAVLKADPRSVSDSRSVLITTIPVGEGPSDVKIPDWILRE